MSDSSTKNSNSPSEPPDNGPVHTTNNVTAKRIIVAWEILRVAYNVILTITGIVGSFVFLNRPPIIPAAVIIGIFANLFFTIGPYSEIILFSFTHKEYKLARIVVFALGLTFSFVLILVFLFFRQFDFSGWTSLNRGAS